MPGQRTLPVAKQHGLLPCVSRGQRLFCPVSPLNRSPSTSPACSTGRLEELKARYVALGSPTEVDWDKMLDGF